MEAGLKEGRKRGAEEAHREVEARFQEEVEPARVAILGLERDWRERWGEHFDGAHEALLGVASAIAEQVIRREVREVPEIIQDKVRDAIDRVSGDYRLRVEIHPADREEVSRYLAAAAAALEENTSIEVVATPDVGRGGCRVRNARSSVDLTVESQLEVIERRLSQARGIE